MNLSALYAGGLDVTISVPGGRELARRTFNPKLGIVDGISIIGTSGIVRPFSNEAFVDAIRREIEVAVAVGAPMLVINSGAICAYPILDSAIRMINQLDTFSGADITKYF